MVKLKYKVINDIPKSFDELKKHGTENVVVKVRGKSMFFVWSELLTGSATRPLFIGNLKDGSLRGSHLSIDYNDRLRINTMFNSHCSIWGVAEFAALEKYAPAEDTKKTKEFMHILRAVFKLSQERTIYNKRTDEPEIGVELEVEHNNNTSSTAGAIMRRTALSLFDIVVADGSVRGGTEIRFKHPSLKDWDAKAITNALTGLKEAGFCTDYGTAGMHIHLSFAKRELTRKAASRFRGALSEMQKILYPICARQLTINGRECPSTKRYGLGSDITRGFTCHDTLEIRVWQATTNPKVFMARVKFADYLIRFLASDTPIEQFFKKMPNKQKENYAFLVKTENPHVFGVGEKAALEMLYK